ATVARGVWGWPWHVLLLVAGLFLALDLTFLSANLHKIPDGGWFPLLVGAVALTLMLTWRRGRTVAIARRSEDGMPLDVFIASLVLGREVPVPSLRPELPLWQERLYAFMVRNAVSAPDYFLIAPQRVVELGTRVEI